eukprot:5478396-Alexandrium_andersonii.AAC.1
MSASLVGSEMCIRDRSRAVECGLCAAAGWQPGTEQAKAARGHGRVLLRKGRDAAGGREPRVPR